MIVFELICVSEHRFEGWFASSEEFERQRQTRLLACPVCATPNVTKLLTAKIGKVAGEANGISPGGQAEPVAPPTPAPQPAPAELIEHVLRYTEDVGSAFPEEARKIHYEDAPRRGIRGVASREEAQELVDEGIEVFPLPISPRRNWN